MTYVRALQSQQQVRLMSCRTVFLHCLMQSEMLFCMQRSGIRYLFSISFMFLTLNLLTYETETTLFLRKNKNFSGCPFTSSLADRCKDVILQYWNQGSAAVEWMHIKLMLQKDKCAFTSQQSLCLVPWGTQHPPLLPSSSRDEEKGLFTGYSSTQHATTDNIWFKMWHLSFSCSSWQKADGFMERLALRSVSFLFI